MRQVRCLAVLVWVSAGTAAAVTPGDATVQAIVERGRQYLESAQQRSPPVEGRMGGLCLIGMVFAKHGQVDHPTVRAAVKSVEEYVGRGDAEITKDELCIYHLGVAGIFLADLDPVRHRPTILRILELLRNLQRPHGGWGYPYSQVGDTSMTQYAVLCLWTADRGSVPIPRESVTRVAGWLTRTQDPTGAWGYQGNDPGNYNRVAQSEVRHSLVAAALGSLYVCFDLTNVSRSPEAQPRNANLPAVLVEVNPLSRGEAKLPPSRNLTAMMSRAVREGNQWMTGNYKIEISRWNMYYLYALERYHSFRESATGKTDPNPPWYQDGVNFLQQRQNSDGSWNADCGPAVDTSFAILFLTRSTQQSIAKDRTYGTGRMLGGRGLPADLRDLQVRQGRVVSPLLATSAGDLLTILEETDLDEQKLATQLAEVRFSADPLQRQAQIDQLRRIVRQGEGRPQLLAIQALARDHSFQNAPYFIYVLETGERSQVLAARDALRRLRRSFTQVGPADGYDDGALRQAVRDWKDWYRAVEPRAEFFEQ